MLLAIGVNCAPLRELYLCNAFLKKKKHLIKINKTTRVVEWEKSLQPTKLAYRYIYEITLQFLETWWIFVSGFVLGLNWIKKKEHERIFFHKYISLGVLYPKKENFNFSMSL